MRFLRSPTPWLAIATSVVAMVPHFIWLKQVNFSPFRYPGDTYSISNHIQSLELVLGYIGHNIALLALPLVVAAVALAWSPRGWMLLQRDPRAFVTQPWSRDANSNVRMHQARNIWIVQGIVAVGPLIGALVFSIYLKTDWGISLFFLTPLAVVAIPQLRLRRAVLVRVPKGRERQGESLANRLASVPEAEREAFVLDLVRSEDGFGGLRTDPRHRDQKACLRGFRELHGDPSRLPDPLSHKIERMLKSINQKEWRGDEAGSGEPRRFDGGSAHP